MYWEGFWRRKKYFKVPVIFLSENFAAYGPRAQPNSPIFLNWKKIYLIGSIIRYHSTLLHTLTHTHHPPFMKSSLSQGPVGKKGLCFAIFHSDHCRPSGPHGETIPLASIFFIEFSKFYFLPFIFFSFIFSFLFSTVLFLALNWKPDITYLYS